MKKTVAFLFRLEGGRALSEKEFVQFASYRLKWFKPTEAQRLMGLAQDLKLVELKAGALTPTFDVAAVDVPMDFKPPPTVLQAAPPPPDLFLTVLNRILERTGADRKAVVAAINGVQDRMDVHVEVAALVHARELGVDVTDLIEPVRASIAKRVG